MRRKWKCVTWAVLLAASGAGVRSDAEPRPAAQNPALFSTRLSARLFSTELDNGAHSTLVEGQPGTRESVTQLTAGPLSNPPAAAPRPVPPVAPPDLPLDEVLGLPAGAGKTGPPGPAPTTGQPVSPTPTPSPRPSSPAPAPANEGKSKP